MIETREVSEEEVAQAFGLNVQQLRYHVALGTPLGLVTYRKRTIWERLLSLFR